MAATRYTDEDPDEELRQEGEDDEASGLYEHFAITADKGQSLLRLDKYLTSHMENCGATASRRRPTAATSWSTAPRPNRATRSSRWTAYRS